MSTGPKLFVSRLKSHWSTPENVYLCNPDKHSISTAKKLRKSSVIIGRLDGTTYYRLTIRNLRNLLIQRRPHLRGLFPALGSTRQLPYFLQRWHDRYLDRGSLWLIKNSAGLVFQSELSLRMHEFFLDFRRADKKCIVIHNGVDLDEYNPKRNTETLEGQPVVIISASVYRPHKRLQDAIRLINRLAKWYPKIKLHVLGNADTLVADIIQTIDCSRCTFHGRVKPAALPEFYASADLQLSLSIFDPCPNVVCEGLASGLPVITPEESGAAELIGNENKRWTLHEGLQLQHYELHIKDSIPKIPVGDYINIFESILDNIKEEKQAARARAEEELDIKKSADRYAMFVNNVLCGLTAK